MNPMYEDMDEEEIEAALREQARQAKALDDEDDDINEPPTKKQKTSSGSKSTKNGSKSEGTKKRKSPQQKANKSPKQKPTPSPLSDDKKEGDDKNDNKKKKKKQNKNMKNLKGGIKYRDMKEGEGKMVKNDDKKVFDKCISGGGFEFNFGNGDVIKGWD